MFGVGSDGLVNVILKFADFYGEHWTLLDHIWIGVVPNSTVLFAPYHGLYDIRYFIEVAVV